MGNLGHRRCSGRELEARRGGRLLVRGRVDHAGWRARDRQQVSANSATVWRRHKRPPPPAQHERLWGIIRRSWSRANWSCMPTPWGAPPPPQPRSRLGDRDYVAEHRGDVIVAGGHGHRGGGRRRGFARVQRERRLNAGHRVAATTAMAFASAMPSARALWRA